MQNTVKELINIEYPGIVKNVDKMLETLGGKESLENTFSQANSRLELFFRPKDIYSHSTLGDRVNTHNLLVKCTKRTTVDSEGKVTVVYESQIVGIIKTCYQFKGLADFQYLPLQPVKPTQGIFFSLIDLNVRLLIVLFHSFRFDYIKLILQIHTKV